MNILSLFDGISCGRVALERAGIKVDKYYASEIDKYAIQITQKNYPDTIQVGDVNNYVDWNIDWNSIDIVMGGSPCQDLSIAKKDRKGLDGEKSGLFWRFVEVLNKAKPKYFLLENVASMSQDAKQIITDILGVEPIMINSALVSAQQRKRLYWTNIPNITQPEDKCVLLKDILISGEAYPVRIPKYGENDKSRPLTAHYSNNCGGWIDRINDPNPAKQQVDLIAEPIKYGDEKNIKNILRNYGSKGKIVTIDNEKSPTIIAAMGSGGGNGIYYASKQVNLIENPVINNKKSNYVGEIVNSGYKNGKQSSIEYRIYSVLGKSLSLNGFSTNYKIDLPDGDYMIRKLYPLECERLQTLPDNYTHGVSNSQRYKAIGNGWTVDVIAHILSGIKEI